MKIIEWNIVKKFSIVLLGLIIIMMLPGIIVNLFYDQDMKKGIYDDGFTDGREINVQATYSLFNVLKKALEQYKKEYGQYPQVSSKYYLDSLYKYFDENIYTNIYKDSININNDTVIIDSKPYYTYIDSIGKNNKKYKVLAWMTIKERFPKNLYFGVSNRYEIITYKPIGKYSYILFRKGVPDLDGTPSKDMYYKKV